LLYLNSLASSRNLKPYEEDDQHIIHLWQTICSAAITQGASDIHIEAHQGEGVVRFRVDGELSPFKVFRKDEHIRIITRIKILAKLDIAEQRIPQDGRLQIYLDHSSPEIDCRLSTLPTLYGEKAVIRILNTSSNALELEEIGFTAIQLRIVERALSQSHGLILVCGPTGSGKTRTLYSFLKYLNHEHLNLCSIEDPIEIRLRGINQVAYHPKAGLDFGVIIKALLRQDPDVIMIGEIRDRDTASLAIQAAQTGHLVLSTIHSRNALSCIERLENLGVDRHAISNNVLFISSQRLHKRIDLGSTGGRLAVHEVLHFSSSICRAIQANESIREIEKIAQGEEFRTMQEGFQLLSQKGMIKGSNLI
jgi:type IV pilus assembly protein PilB